MAAKFLKGALISFMPTFLGATPNVTVFQINPETLTHAWTAAAAAQPPPGQKEGGDPLAVKGLPGESFSFTLVMDANDEIADVGANPVAAGLASLTGLYTRLAALEMLQYPLAAAGAGLLGSVSASISSSGLSLSASVSKTSDSSVPRMQVPVVLFVWGPQRIVPVRVTQLTITEKLYDTALNPSHAEAQIGLRVLTPDELVSITGPMKDVAKIAYVYTQGLRQVQATANLADAAASIIGMLPTPF
jgi:hypothetical protein